MIVAIDPGSAQSAYVVWDELAGVVRQHGIEPNAKLLVWLRTSFDLNRSVVIEMMQPRGMPTAAEEMEALWWAGQFAEASRLVPVHRVLRKDVKVTICGSTRANDTNIRAAIIDRFGGKDKAIGLKKHPGPLYGVKADEWAALGVALTFMERGPWTGGST